MSLPICALLFAVASHLSGRDATPVESEIQAVTLDEIARELLFDPAVLVALGVTPEQQYVAVVRQERDVLVRIYEAAMAARQPEAPKISLQFQIDPPLTMDLLTSDQAARLRMLAVHRFPFRTLSTMKVRAAMSFTDEQRAAIDLIEEERLRATVASAAEAALSLAKEGADFFSGEEDDEEYRLQLRHLLDKVHESVVVLHRAYERMVQEREPGDADEIAKTFSPEQRLTFERLAGAGERPQWSKGLS
jgi:hypothetical protein